MTATVGHNTKLDEQQRRTLFSHHFRKDMEIEGKLRGLRNERKANRLLAKEAGFPSSKIDHYLKAFYGEDDQKPVEKHRSERENLIWLGLIQDDTKADLLGDRVSREQLIQGKGFNAGLLNLERVSGYDGGSADDKLWLQSYDAGKAEYDTNIPDILAMVEQSLSKETPIPDGGDPFRDEDLN